MIAKKQLFKHIESLPDQVDIEDLIERLLLINKLTKRKVESENDDTISEEELDQEIEKWLR